MLFPSLIPFIHGERVLHITPFLSTINMLIKNLSRVYGIIRNEILTAGIGEGGHYYNDHVFYPLNENGYRDYRYYQPRFCISRNPNRKKDGRIDIKNHREGTSGNSLMNQGRTPQVSMMWERLKGVDCIRELVILLSDSDLSLYRLYLTEEGYNEEGLIGIGQQRTWYQNYFSADFYLPKHHAIIELDSSYHKYPGIDKARDRVLNDIYELKTTRFWGYDKRRTEYEGRLKKILEDEKSEPLYFNQLDLLIERFIIENPELVARLDEEITKGNKEPLKSLYM